MDHMNKDEPEIADSRQDNEMLLMRCQEKH